MDVDFEMFAARNVKFKELEKTEQNFRGSYKLIGNCERKFKAWVDHSIKNTILHEATKQAKTKSLKKHLKNQE